MINRMFVGLMACAVVMMGGCVKRVGKSDKAEEHERWAASLEDSVASLKKEVSEAEMRLDEATARVSELLPEFDHVSNPREVEGYIMLKGWRSRYPLTSTGIVARITEGEGLELVAALSGGSFTSIAVSDGGSSVESDVVPHDQALNYRTQGLNTVAFQGPAADSIAAFIASHVGENLELSFSENGVSGRLAIPAANRRMIARTWDLYSARREVERLEKTLPLLNSKIRAVRSMKDRLNSANDSHSSEE